MALVAKRPHFTDMKAETQREEGDYRLMQDMAYGFGVQSLAQQPDCLSLNPGAAIRSL